jgi:hypothetical protein
VSLTSIKVNLNKRFMLQMAFNKKLRWNAPIVLIILAFWVQLSTPKVRLLHPVSFGVVRSSSISVNLPKYMENIGYPATD